MTNDKREQQRVAFAQLLLQAREDMPAQIEYEQLKAKLTRAKYLELVAQGFTEAQALELCKS